MKSKCMTLLLSAGILFSLALLNSSCGGDDDNNSGNSACDALSKELGEQTLTWVDVVEKSENCEEIEAAYNDLIEIYKKGKSCDPFVKGVKAAGFDSVDQYIDFLEDARDDFLADC